jgi:hypothetical protein
MKQIITIIQQSSDQKRQVQFMRLVIGVSETKEEAIEFATTYPNGTHINVVDDWEIIVIIK